MQSISDVQLANMETHFKNITKIGLMTRRIILADHLAVSFYLLKFILIYLLINLLIYKVYA